jgi:uncharacterized membrane protein (UPF0127 family)
VISALNAAIVHGVNGRVFSVRNESGAVVCRRCLLADTFFSRLRGLLGRRELQTDEGLLLTPAWSVHTWFMHFPIDVVFLESDLTVLATRESVKPWRLTAWRGARSVLELPAGTCERRGLRPGARLALAEAEDENASVLLVLGQNGNGNGNVVVGRGPLSAATRTIDAMSDLDVDVSAVVLRDDADDSRLR